MTREGEPEDELPNNVIAFPKPRVEASNKAETAETAPSAEGNDEALAAPTEARAPADSANRSSESENQDDAEAPTMTLDAFERAVRAAVRDKLGDEEPSSTPRGADELVAQVFSALTGKDARSALAEVRSRLSEPLGSGEPSDGEGSGDAADVIDLAAIREARQKQSMEAASKVGHAIKDTLSGFISTIAQRQGHTGEITLDANFFKQHGPTLLGNLFQSLAASFMQQARSNLGPNPPAPSEPTPPPSEPAEAPPAAEPSATSDQPTGTQPADTQPKAAQPVQVRLDVGSLLTGLFKRLGRPAQPDPDDPKT